MARTHSRKIPRRAVKKKSPLPAVLVLLYMLGLSLAYVYLYVDSSNLKSQLDGKKEMVVGSEHRMRNLNAEVEKYTRSSHIKRKVQEFNLGLRVQISGQVVDVQHFEHKKGPTAQQLREESDREAMAAVER